MYVNICITIKISKLPYLVTEGLRKKSAFVNIFYSPKLTDLDILQKNGYVAANGYVAGNGYVAFKQLEGAKMTNLSLLVSQGVKLVPLSFFSHFITVPFTPEPKNPENSWCNLFCIYEHWGIFTHPCSFYVIFEVLHSHCVFDVINIFWIFF